MVVWLNRTMIVLCQGFCYIKDIRISIVIWIINNNVATEITCLQKNIVALKNLAPLWVFSSPCPSENLLPPCPPTPQLLKSSPQSHIFSPPENFPEKTLAIQFQIWSHRWILHFVIIWISCFGTVDFKKSPEIKVH